MKYIETLRDGDSVRDTYLCKQKNSAMTKNGKSYDNVTFQDKTGTIDGKIWDPNSMGIGEFEALDYVEITGDVTTFNGALQLNVKSVRKAEEGSFNPADYLPCSRKDVDGMYKELLMMIESVKNRHFKELLKSFFVEDKAFINAFKKHSAAKTIHHSFIGGLLEHTLSVTKMCDYFAKSYPIINRDLIITSAIFHDIGKVYELSSFPKNDYTDEGQLLGHIVVGFELISKRIDRLPDFPEKLGRELKHCIIAHHGEMEYGSPKKPALAEAFALNLADNADARLETLSEILTGSKPQEGTEWYGYNRVLESNIRKSSVEELL